jgi:four helix bundle protein
MAKIIFDHDKLDVYRLSIEYVAESFREASKLGGLYRHAREQWLRAAQSVPLNIAEGNGKRSWKDRSRFFEFARGSALECAAIHDVLNACGGIEDEVNWRGKERLHRIVSMLTRLVHRGRVGGSVLGSREDEFEQQFVEYEHVWEAEE